MLKDHKNPKDPVPKLTIHEMKNAKLCRATAESHLTRFEFSDQNYQKDTPNDATKAAEHALQYFQLQKQTFGPNSW